MAADALAEQGPGPSADMVSTSFPRIFLYYSSFKTKSQNPLSNKTNTKDTFWVVALRHHNEVIAYALCQSGKLR